MKRSMIIEELQKEIRRLTEIINTTSRRLQNTPEGSVRIIKHGKGYQYFQRTDHADSKGVYIPTSERPKAVALIQKSYDKKVLMTAEKQKNLIERFLKGYNTDKIKNIYDSLSEIRKSSIIPEELPDKEYVQKWKSFQYIPKSISDDVQVHYTSAGERVRSKSEVMIAEALKQANVAYHYERPLELDNTLIYPDFTILRTEDREVIYWEHLGMMDDPGYCNNAIQRIRMYENNNIYLGLNLIITMETSLIPINLAVINNMIKKYCI